MVTLDLDAADCRNAAELIDIYLPLALKDFYEAGEFDSLEYVRSMLKVYDELKKAAGEEKRRRCPKRHIIEEMEANKMEDDDRLEMGFDPYLGCYTDDC